MRMFVVATVAALLAIVIPILHSPGNLCAQSRTQDKEQGRQEESEQNKVDEDDFGIVGPVRIQIIHETGTLIVTGENEDDVRKVEALIKKIIESAEQARPNSQMIKLTNAHAKYVAPWAQHLYDRNFAARQGAVTITAHSQSELFIVGPPAALDEAKKIVMMLDR